MYEVKIQKLEKYLCGTYSFFWKMLSSIEQIRVENKIAFQAIFWFVFWFEKIELKKFQKNEYESKW